MKSKTIDKVFPIYAVENDLLISKTGNLSLVYKMSLPQIYSLDVTEIDEVNEIFDKMIRSLPEDTVIQKQDYFFVDEVRESITTPKSLLTRSDNQFFYEKPTLSHECYLIITKNSRNTISLSSNPKMYDTYISEFESFSKMVFSAISYLTKEAYFDVKRLKSEEIIKLLEVYFSLSQENDNVFKDIFFDKKLQVGGKHVEVFALSSNDQLPIIIESSKRHAEFSTAKTNFRTPFIQPITTGLDCNHIYNQIIYIENAEKLYKVLKLKLNKFKSLAVLSPENQLTYNQIQDVINEVLEKELKFVKQHFSIFIWNNTIEGLEKDSSNLKNGFKDLGLTPYEVKFALKNVFFNNCPGAALSLSEDFKFIGVSEQSPLFINFESYYESNKDGILFCDRKNNSPIRLDLWDEPIKRGLIVNRNRLIFGPSGTGKSFLINHIASQYYEQGHHIVMIDIGNSYKKLCQLCKGQYFTYDVGESLQFNPFYLGDEKITVEKKVFIISLIIFLWKGDDPYRREEKQILAMYIDAYYQKLDKDNTIFPCMSTFFEFVRDNKILEKEDTYFDKMSFELSMQDFDRGKYGEILNSREPINLVAERFIVFEMDNIKDHPVLFPLVTMLCIDLIMSKLRQVPNEKKSIFIDECWKPISKGEMAEFIKYLYKTVRKYYGEVAIATQDVEDILDTAAGPAMINNTDTMILLSHKKKMGSKDKFAKYLSFSEGDLEKLFSTDKREVFIKVGNISNVYKVSVSPERYACYSSNADENRTIYEVYNKTNNMELALNQFVERNN